MLGHHRKMFCAPEKAKPALIVSAKEARKLSALGFNPGLAQAAVQAAQQDAKPVLDKLDIGKARL